MKLLTNESLTYHVYLFKWVQTIDWCYIVIGTLQYWKTFNRMKKMNLRSFYVQLSFSLTGCLSRLECSVFSTVSPIARVGEKRWTCTHFMEISTKWNAVSSRLWSCLDDSISFDNNHDNTAPLSFSLPLVPLSLSLSLYIYIYIYAKCFQLVSRLFLYRHLKFF